MKMPRVRSVVLLSLALSIPTFGQQPAPSSNDGGQSLAEVARKLRKDHTVEVKMTEEDTKKLLGSVDKLIDFASEDSGFPKHAAVKSRLVAATEVEKYTKERLAKAEYSQRFARAELTMKKFGLLPRDFSLREFLVRSNGKGIAGYYDDETKMISLLNWIPLDRQAPILAHELTHALQDQNYDLKRWMTAASKASNKGSNDDSASARHAVVEGQAMVVLLDYILAPVGRNLQNTPGITYAMEDPAVKATIDSELMHDAPMVLREAGSFPYNAGLILESELLQKGGKQMAFAGAFANPPRSTHEVLQPRAYLEGEKLPALPVPDTKALVKENYEVFDSGSFGELDVRALLKQYGNRKIADGLAASWQGGTYITFRKAAVPEPSSTSDLTLLYVSRWKSVQTAERFARLYAEAVSTRYQQAVMQDAPACSETSCPVLALETMTEDGPVSVQQWADNMVIIEEGFDATTAGKLRDAIRRVDPDAHAGYESHGELSLRLAALPEFAGLQEEVGRQILQQMFISLVQ